MEYACGGAGDPIWLELSAERLLQAALELRTKLGLRQRVELRTAIELLKFTYAQIYEQDPERA